MHFLDDPVSAVSALPALPLVLPLFVLVSGMLEYVIPPYWGDMFMLVGFFLAGQPSIPVSPAVIFVAAVVGSILGSIVAFLLGQRYGLGVMRRITPPWRSSDSGERIRELLLRHGERLLIANRMVPVIRGLLLYGAGALKLRFRHAIGYSAVSNLIWVTVLMTLGLWTAESWDGIVAAFRNTHRILGSIAAVAILGWAAFAFWRYRLRHPGHKCPGYEQRPLKGAWNRLKPD